MNNFTTSGAVLVLIAAGSMFLGAFVAIFATARNDPSRPSFQSRVADWLHSCFPASLYSNMTERGDRLLEEVFELLQSKGYDRSRIATLVDYVWGRAIGEPSQENGGVMVTLAAYNAVAGLDMEADGEKELARITRPDVIEKIRAKQEAKNKLKFDTIPLELQKAGQAGPHRGTQR